MPTAQHPTPGISRQRTVGAIVAALVLLGGLAVLGERGLPQLSRFTTFVHGLGVWGPVTFIAGYALATVALVPGTILTLAAGPLFGIALGVVYVFVGATLGAIGGFLIARFIARGAVERLLAGNHNVAAIDRAIGREGRTIVFLLRLSPLFPFTLLNYALGLTQVRFADFLLASIGMLPGTLLYVYLGKLGGDAVAAAGGATPATAATWALRLVGLAATIAVTRQVTRTAQRALRTAADL